MRVHTSSKRRSHRWIGLAVVLLAMLVMGMGVLGVVAPTRGARASESPTAAVRLSDPTPPADVCAYIKVLPFTASIDPGIVVNSGPGITMNDELSRNGNGLSAAIPTATASASTLSPQDCYSVAGPVLLSGTGRR